MADNHARPRTVPPKSGKRVPETGRLELVLTCFALVLVVLFGSFVAALITRSLESLAPGLGAGADAQRIKRAVLGACAAGASVAFMLFLTLIRLYVGPLARRTEALFRELVRESAEAEERVRNKNEFLANLSHEVRTPMNGIVGMTDLLLSTKLDGRQRRYARTVQTSAGALLNVLNDVLDLAKIEAGKLELHASDCDARRMVEEVAELLAPQAQAKGVELAVRVSERVPPLVRCDRDRVRQVLTSLATNAVKFTERGEVVIRGDLREEDAGRFRLAFTIDDTGPGIPKKAQSRLFEAPAAANQNALKPALQGKSLALARELVELMQGAIGVASASGAGSHFWFDVPVTPSARSARADGPAHFPVRALVVDDNLTNLAILREQLAAWGMHVKCATRGDDALELVKAAIEDDAPFELAVLDHQMPRMHGGELARRLRVELGLRSLPIVLLTSDGAGQLDEARQHVDEALTKPARQSELRRVLGLALDRYRTRPSGPISKPCSPQAAMAHARLPGSPRVLVAEDDLGNPAPLTPLLEELGCAVDRVTSGTAVLAALTRSDYALVLLDAETRALDAHEAVRRIRAGAGSRARLPVVAVTANTAAGERAKALLAGMDDCLLKPVPPTTLYAVLDSWLSSADQEPPTLVTTTSAAPAEHEAACAAEAAVFLARMRRDLQALLEAYSADDWARVSATAQRLNSGAAGIGGRRLAQLCAELVEDPKRSELVEAIVFAHEAVASELGKGQAAS